MNFARPKKRELPDWRKVSPPDAPPSDFVARAVPAGTVAALIGLAITAAVMFGKLPSAIAKSAALGVAFSLALSVAYDFRKGVRNLIRADLMALAALYFLTFFEFLFPQPLFDQILIVESTRTAIHTVLIGFAGILIGRHLWHPKRAPLERMRTAEMPPVWFVTIFWLCFAIGYFHMIYSAKFDVSEMLYYFLEPRFSQPWTRGRLGDWSAMLVELGMLLYLLPPLAGIVFARRHRFGKFALTGIAAGTLFTFFYGFTTGTRNIFAAYLVTFLIGFAFASPPERKKQVVTLTIVISLTLLTATSVMLQFRQIGFRNWWEAAPVRATETHEQSMFIDYNLYAIGCLVEVFPHRHAYLGWEVPYNALIRPIPRALWKGKPEGLSVTIEDAMEVSGLTIATTFVGEAYMAGGYLAVFVTALFFGALAGWWSYMGSARNSEVGTLIYASGFFAAVISMRSLFVFTTAALPTLASIALGMYLGAIVIARVRRFAGRTPVVPQPPLAPRGRRP